MAFIFPDDKADFIAPNGVTYHWDGTKWVTKTFKSNEGGGPSEPDSRLPYRLGTDKAARVGEAAVELVDAQDNYSNVKFFGDDGISCASNIQGITISGDNLQKQIDELGVTKGTVARYVVDNIDGKPVSRPGQLSTNNPFWSNVVLLSFGTEDADNVLTKPMNDDDIIEFVDVITNKVSRYKITDASAAPTVVSVEYVSGNSDFAPGQEKQVFIYPQNTATVSKDYVDEGLAGKLDNAGANELPNDTDWKVRQQNAGGANKTLIQVQAGELGLYNLKEPNEAHHAASKGYVDSLGGPKPAQLSWIYDGSKSSGSAPSDGKFYKNDDYLRFSFKTNNGVDLSNGLCDDTGAMATEYGPVGVIWYYSKADKNWKMKRQFRVQSWRWNYNNHFEFMLSSSKGHAWSSFTKDAVYHITIGGWF